MTQPTVVTVTAADVQAVRTIVGPTTLTDAQIAEILASTATPEGRVDHTRAVEVILDMTVTIDYRPAINGAGADPEPEGGAVDTLALYDGLGALVLTVGPAVRISAGLYRFSFIEPAAGTYRATVTWRATATAAATLDENGDHLYPRPIPGLVVPIDPVARQVGLPTPVSARARAVVMEAIQDAQSDVEAYLGQAILPVLVVEGGRYSYGAEWNLSQPATRVVKVVAEVDPATGLGLGTFQISYFTGLDAASDPVLRPIRRYVNAHAAALARQSPVIAEEGVKRTIRSVNVEGQGITYGDTVGQANTAGGGSGQVGTLPVLASLSRWRRRNVFQRRG